MQDVLESHKYLEDLDMEKMIEAFYSLQDGDSDANEESENDPIIEHLQVLASTPVYE